MGYSSYLCKSCNNSIASNDCLGCDPQTGRQKTHWLMECVLLGDGVTVVGTFDGYGNVVSEEGHEVDVYDTGRGAPVMLHKACWGKMGRPAAGSFDGPSAPDPHQGNPPDDVWSLLSPLDAKQYRWVQIAKFGARRYFRDENSGRISQVGDSGATPDRSEDGILWVDVDGDRPVAWEKFGSIPMVQDFSGAECRIGADTKEECMWVANTFGIPTQGFQTYDWELLWKSPGPSSRAARVFFDRNSPQGKPRYAICDSSGGKPHTTEDGVMWIDTSKSIVFGNEGFRVPVLSNSGQSYSTPVFYADADFVAFKCGMEIVSADGKYKMALEAVGGA